MDRFNRKMDAPLCKFGPGGDFTSQWDSQKPNLAALEGVSPIGKVLNLIAEVIGAAVQPEILTEIACALPPIDESQNNPNPTLSSQEIQTDGQTAIVRLCANQPQAVSRLKAGRTPAGQSMLFSNDWRTGTDLKHKPGHRIRTHRRASRKKPVDTVHGQGSLFETGALRRKTA
jgi:hypothetical protein